MKKRHALILVLLVLFFPIRLKADTFSFRHYKAEDGLASNTVRSIIQDRHGFMWFGTEDGLSRFDGYTFREFRMNRSSKYSLGSNYIATLLEDTKGDIWIGTDDGVYVYHPYIETFSHFQVKARGVSISSSVNNIVEDKLGNIWFSTYGQGLFRYNLSSCKLEQYKIIKQGTSFLNYDFINYVYVDHSNLVWAAPKTPYSPLILFNRTKNSFQVIPLKIDGAKDFSIYKIFEDSRHDFWLGTWDKGLCKFDRKTKKVNNYLSPKSQGGILHIHEISEYKPNVLFIGSDDGLCLFDTKNCSHRLFTSSELDIFALSDKFVYPIFKDREGGIWVGTYFGGVNYVSPNNGLFERYAHSKYVNSVNGNVISRFTEDKKGNIWMASDDGGLILQDAQSGRFSAYMPMPGQNSLSYHNVHALCWDEDNLWIGTYAGGLNVLDTRTGKFRFYNYEESNSRSLDGGSIYSIYRDRDKQMWVASMSGINLYDRKADNFIRVKYFNATTIDITQDKRGWIWFATQGKGVFRFNPKTRKWTNYASLSNNGSSIPCSQTNCVLVDKKGQLWLGTSTGLCRYNSTKDVFELVTLNISGNTICSIIEDRNYLWLTTSKGLVRYNTTNGNCQVFTKSDGLLSDQFIANSGFKSSKGKIYIGTANGFNAFYPHNIVINKHLPLVAITSLEVSNKEVEIDSTGLLPRSVSFTDQIDLSYKDNVFSLGFSALSYTTPEKNMYAYKLEGFDKEWNYVNKQHKATYTNLPAGEYVFRVKASNSDGVWNEQGASVKIVIHPPFWLTTGFKILYLLIAIALGTLIVKSIIRRSERKHREKIKELSQEKEKEMYNARIQFFTMIAHEIRTPVSLIIGPLEKIITAGFSFPDFIRKDLNIIDQNSQRLLNLVNQLLDFRKVEQGALVMSFKCYNIYKLLTKIYDRFKPILEQNKIEFILDCPDTEFEAIIDQEAVTKIVSNLLTNAMKFTDNQIMITCIPSPDRGTFEIRVSDNGVGIPDEEKEKVFMIFYQVSSCLKPGTGIGLSLVKSLVDAHKGTISVIDTNLKGATFVVTLPLQNAEGIADKDVLEETISLPLQQLIIEEKEPSANVDEKADKPLLLIVEDNEDMRNFLRSSFTDHYKVITACDGLEGVDKLKQNEVNLIISDLMMPRMDGMELCQSVRSNVLWSHIPFILLTAKTDMNSKIDGLNFGADSYIEKPFSINYLIAQINSLLESRRLLKKKYAEMPFVSLTTIAGNSSDELFLSKMNSVIERNISNIDFSIDLLAEELCISRSGLFAKIKTLADVTPNELIQLVRLKKAAEYLVKNEYRINEIAYMVGFNNPSYFSKCFQKQFGVRPMEFASKYNEKNTPV